MIPPSWLAADGPQQMRMGAVPYQMQQLPDIHPAFVGCLPPPVLPMKVAGPRLPFPRQPITEIRDHVGEIWSLDRGSDGGSRGKAKGCGRPHDFIMSGPLWSR
jgi:hypothetical protein